MVGSVEVKLENLAGEIERTSSPSIDWKLRACQREFQRRLILRYSVICHNSVLDYDVRDCHEPSAEDLYNVRNGCILIRKALSLLDWDSPLTMKGAGQTGHPRHARMVVISVACRKLHVSMRKILSTRSEVVSLDCCFTTQATDRPLPMQQEIR